jgi:site-specific DNA-adenine methylase
LKGYAEPFCGFLGVYRHIPSLLKFKNYIASDINKSIICMWNKAITGWKPQLCKLTFERYQHLRFNGKSSAEKGFIGHLFAFRAQYFDMPKLKLSERSKHHGINKLKEVSDSVKRVKFTHSAYDKLSNLKNHVIYCDPPYKIQAHYYDEYGKSLRFDHTKFREWCQKMALHNLVLVSEQEFPIGKCIFKLGKEKLYKI